MTILFVLENYYPKIGGVETLFRTLTDELTARGHHCIVVTSWPGGDIPLREQNGSLEIRRVRVWSRYLFTVLAVFPILGYLRRADLVHTTSYNAAFPAFLATRLVRRPVVITFHEVWGRLWFRLPLIGVVSKWGHYLFEQMLLRLSFDQFVAVSESTASRLREEGVDADRIRVVYPGIDYAQFDPVDLDIKREQDVFIYTYFGRLGISKGLDLLLEAARRVKKEIPNSRLQLILPDKPRWFFRWVKKYITRNDLERHIIMRQHLPFDELKKAIVASDCVVVPSHSEGFCFVAVESIALGTPVISSDRAALREVVGGRHIKLSALSASGIAAALKAAHDGNWSESPVRRFHLKETIAGYLEIYQSLTGQT